jgi:hypothetical protein
MAALAALSDEQQFVLASAMSCAMIQTKCENSLMERHRFRALAGLAEKPGKLLLDRFPARRQNCRIKRFLAFYLQLGHAPALQALQYAVGQRRSGGQ